MRAGSAHRPPRPLRVAVNLLWCTPGRVGGSEEYLTRQLLGIAELLDAPGVEVAAEGDLQIDLYTSAAFAAAHGELLARFARRGPRGDMSSQPLRILTEHTWLAAATRRADLVHHAGGTAPVVGRRPRVVTVHDLQYLRYPEYFSRARLAYLRAMVPRSVASAEMVLVPSQYVRTRVVEACGVAPERVRVVPHGIQSIAAGTVAQEAGLRARYGLGDGPVFVYPAITHPHKNHTLLLTAMARYWTDPDLRLVLLGGRGGAEAEVVQMIGELGLGDRVVRPGRVSDADRDGLIALAAAMVFPSRYEGFGAPLIEAMALGTPVVACGLTAVTEVVDGAGLLRSEDPEDWADVPQAVDAERERLVVAGYQRSAEFSLAASGRALWEAYRAAVGAITDGER